jgi:hypothetical protein
MSENYGRHTEVEFRVRCGRDVDEFTDEGDAQEWAVQLARQGEDPKIYKRTVTVTRVVGQWFQVPAITPAEADAEMARAEADL